ncbi:MAG: glycosyltransferase [bacterium]|nr:glycosyltransferase [bacterium]
MHRSRECGSSIVIDVIIINYNASPHLQRLLGSLLNGAESIKSRPRRVSITVVDNASTDGSAGMVETRFPEVKLIARAENGGYSTAVNEGLSATRERLILLMNSDVDLTPDALFSLCRVWERLDFPALLAPLHLEDDGWPQLTWGERPIPAAEWRRRRLERGLALRETWARNEAARIAARTRLVDWVSGSCMLFPRLTVEDAGRWDENFFLYFEDIDWCLRILEHGGRIYHTPEVRVRHVHGASMKTERDATEIEYRLSQCYFTRKHFGALALWRLRGYLTMKMVWRLFWGGWSDFSRASSWRVLINTWKPVAKTEHS